MGLVVRLFVQPINIKWKQLFSIFALNTSTSFKGVDESMRFNRKAHEDRLQNSPFL
jgi:hypothetical protein